MKSELITFLAKFYYRHNLTAGQSVVFIDFPRLWGKVSIGDYSRFNGKLIIKGEVDIGKYFAFGGNIRIIAANHRTDLLGLQSQFYTRFFGKNILEKDHVRIGNNVWVGDGAIILSGVKVGDGAIIGAGSVVTKNIPPYSIAVGNPAKVLRLRIPEKFHSIAWWNWSTEEIQKNKDLFLKSFSDSLG